MDKPPAMCHSLGMARTPKNHEAAAELGERLTQLKQEHANPTPKDIELWVYGEFGVRLGEESIRKAHKGLADPHSCDPELLAGIAHYYGVAPVDLTPAVAERFMSLTKIAGLAPEFSVRDLEFAMKRCTSARLWAWQPSLWVEDEPPATAGLEWASAA